MDIDDDDMEQPSSSSGPKGDKKRFEVKKVRKVDFFVRSLSMIFIFFVKIII